MRRQKKVGWGPNSKSATNQWARAATFFFNSTTKVCPFQVLLDQALARYQQAIEQNDLEKAEAHRKIYVSLFPLAFAGLMQNSLAGGSLSKN